MSRISEFSHHIRRLLSMPPPVAAKKVFVFLKGVISSRAERVLVKTCGADVSEAEFFRSFRAGVKDALRSFRERQNVLMAETKALKEDDPDTVKKVILSAEKICVHRFDLLGSGETFLGEKIDWHADFKTGYRWDPKGYYKDIYIPYGKGDIKVPWELSRFQHLVLLGQSYRISEDERYSREFVAQIADWIINNPVKLGPNWACTMDIAIRAANWLAAWEFFKCSPSISDEFASVFLKSILSHGKFIRNNLEYSDDLTSNHYLSDISGLFFVACMVPEFKESKEWLDFSKKELESEMGKQVYEDGCDFEASTSYHRLVLELFFYPAYLGKRRGIVFSEGYNSRLKRMFEAVLYLLKPNGKMPQIGDNDSGRFFKYELPGTDVLDMRYLLPLAAVYFDDPMFKIVYDIEDHLFPVFWLFGKEGVERWKSMRGRRVEDIESKPFPDAGWYIMRSEKDYMIVSCGPNGQKGNGGHCHNDKLSFELCMDGQDIFIDPGTYLYTPDPEMRNLFRSTYYHNTVTVNYMEQNRLPKGCALFTLQDESRARPVLWESDTEHDRFTGEHFGFDKSGFHHQREICFNKTGRIYSVIDKITGERPKSIAYFHLAPNGGVVKVEDGLFRVRNAVIKFAGFYDIEVIDSWYSKEYGIKEQGSCIKVSFADTLKTRICCEDVMDRTVVS